MNTTGKIKKNKMQKQENAIKELKKCTRCNVIKESYQFSKCNSSKDGLQFRCKVCRSEDMKVWRKNNEEYCKKYAHESWLNNKESKSKYSKKYQTLNKEQQKTYSKKHRQTKKGIETRKKYRKIEYKLKYGIDTEWTLKLILRNRLKNAVKNNFQKGKTLKILGCSIQDLKLYLEQQFNNNMNWDNYGKNKYWEIDHIKPCSSFNLTDIEQQKQCFHYTNLQPLTILQNRIKKDKYEAINSN